MRWTSLESFSFLRYTFFSNRAKQHSYSLLTNISRTETAPIQSNNSAMNKLGMLFNYEFSNMYNSLQVSGLRHIMHYLLTEQ